MHVQLDSLTSSAGSQGLSVPKLTRLLGLDNKKYAKRLDIIGKRMGVVETEEQAGKTIMRHWTAPPTMLQQHRAAMPPPKPTEGWIGLVQSTIEVRVPLLPSAYHPPCAFKLTSVGV